MSNKEIYVIYSPGRTGSHLILESIAGTPDNPGGLCNAYGFDAGYQGLFKFDNNVVIHSHCGGQGLNIINQLGIDSKKVTLILSYRQDIFAAIMSSFVTKITNEWNGKNYSNKVINPFEVAKDDFLRLVDGFTYFPGEISFHNYKKVISICYEDILKYRVPYIAAILGVEYNETQVGLIQKQNTRSYKDYILNWEDLYQEFLFLDNNNNK